MFFFKQKTAYEMVISYWSLDVCSSDLGGGAGGEVDDAALARRGADRDGVRLIGDRSLPQRHRARRGGGGVLAERGAETTRSGGGGPEGAGALALRGCPFTAVPKGVGIKIDPSADEHTSELQLLMRISYAVFC